MVDQPRRIDALQFQCMSLDENCRQQSQCKGDDGSERQVLRAFGRDEGSLRRESQLGHASTVGEDTAVNQGVSKLDNTIRLWPIPVVFDGVKPERMLLISHCSDMPASGPS